MFVNSGFEMCWIQQGLEIRGFWFQEKTVQLKTALREAYTYVLKGFFFQKTVYLQGFCSKSKCCTGKSLSEALIFASTNPQYDDRLFIVLENCKLRISTCRTCCVQKLFFVLFCFDIQNIFGTQHVLQMLRASEEDLPVPLSNNSLWLAILRSKLSWSVWKSSSKHINIQAYLVRQELHCITQYYAQQGIF